MRQLYTSTPASHMKLFQHTTLHPIPHMVSLIHIHIYHCVLYKLLLQLCVFQILQQLKYVHSSPKILLQQLTAQVILPHISRIPLACIHRGDDFSTQKQMVFLSKHSGGVIWCSASMCTYIIHYADCSPSVAAELPNIFEALYQNPFIRTPWNKDTTYIIIHNGHCTPNFSLPVGA